MVNNKSFRNARIRDIIDFLEIVSNYDVVYKTIDFKDYLPETQWGYKVELSFPMEMATVRHLRPTGFTQVEIVVEIDVESSIKEWDNLNDPFTSLSFRSMLRGTNPITGKLHYLSFHVDRHNGAKTTEVHPLYHVQYLQNGKVKDNFDHGESMQLDVPRMMHFPLEVILGVSLLLSNFAPGSYAKLIQNRAYKKISRVYQEKIWRPYINSLESFWLNPIAVAPTWEAKLNCPYLT
jgi:hypothetical protein